MNANRAPINVCHPRLNSGDRRSIDLRFSEFTFNEGVVIAALKDEVATLKRKLADVEQDLDDEVGLAQQLETELHNVQTDHTETTNLYTAFQNDNMELRDDRRKLLAENASLRSQWQVYIDSDEDSEG